MWDGVSGGAMSTVVKKLHAQLSTQLEGDPQTNSTHTRRAYSEVGVVESHESTTDLGRQVEHVVESWSHG